MKLRIVKHRKASRDVARVFVYLGEQNFDAAERFLIAVDSDLKKLAEMPGMGARREFKSPRVVDIRYWLVSDFKNYIIFYRVKNDTLEFLRLIHAARGLEKAWRE